MHTTHGNHDEGSYLQQLPACLAPAEPDRSASDCSLPAAGAPVVLLDGCVLFLQYSGADTPASGGGAWICAAPMRGADRCGGADWAAAYPLDPDHLGLDEGDAEAIRAALHLLLAEHAAVS